MNRKDKMNMGLYYDPHDERLMCDRMMLQKRLNRYNRLLPFQAFRRKSLIQLIIPNSGFNCSIYPPFFCDYGYNIYIGNNFFANVGCIILDSATVTIGDNVMLGPHTIIAAANHPYNPYIRNEGVIFGEPIIIEDNVWIGANCVLNPGTKIGKNTIIGSGSVVTGVVPENTIAAGNPCKVIKPLLTDKREVCHN